ncbi:hypothetical protein L6R50_13770 [Myxococcota bacterium]|nr:hypothetical protein [Myxococcota bacterium]
MRRKLFASLSFAACLVAVPAVVMAGFPRPPVPGGSGGGTGIQAVLDLGEGISFRFYVAARAAIRAEFVLMEAAGLAEKVAVLEKKLSNIENSSDDVEKAAVAGEVMSETDKLAEESRQALAKKESLSDDEKEQIRRADQLHFWAGLNLAAIGLDIAAASVKVTNAMLHANPIAEATQLGKLKRIDKAFKTAESNRKAFESSKKRNDELMDQIYKAHQIEKPDMASVKAEDKEPEL